MADYDVIVIGAGCGGLSAASLLAKQGRKVLVVEQSSAIGGCCSTFERNGFHFDVGASIVEIIHPIEVLFQRLGTELRQELDLIACDPLYSCITSDGSRFEYPQSIDQTAAVIKDFSPDDAKNWYKYAAKMDDFTHLALQHFFLSPASTLGDMAKMFIHGPGLLKYGGLFVSSYQDIIFKYFKHETIRESFGFQSHYIGLPPELCAGHYAMLPYCEQLGIYYPRGGMIKVPESIKNCGERLGMEVKLNTCVDRVMIRNKKATGVVLADGTEITAKIVVSNINAKVLYLKLIGEEHLPRLVKKGIKSYDYSMSTPMIYLGLNYRPPLHAHHTLVTIPVSQMNDYWWKDYKQGRFPDNQFGILCCPTLSDPSLAPEGHHILNLTLAPGAYRLSESDWDTEKNGMIERIVKYLSDTYVPGLEEHVVEAAFTTPLDFERMLLSPEGAIYALNQDVTNSTVFRPSSKSKCIDGLYLVGASTHPGGGIPAVIASGVVAADQIEKYEH